MAAKPIFSQKPRRLRFSAGLFIAPKSLKITDMKPDLRGKMIGLSDMLVELPSSRSLATGLLLVGFAAGFLMRIVQDPSKVFEAIWYGGTEGFCWLFLPALLAAALASSFTKKKFFQYYLATSFVATVVVAIGYIAGVTFLKQFSLGLNAVVLVSNAFAVLVWFIAARVVLTLNTAKSLMISLAHPVFNLAFIAAAAMLGIAQGGLGIDLTTVTLIKFAVSTGILLTALGAMVYVLNAPSKRNFGVSTVEAITLFFGQWIHGDKGLEDFLGAFGQTVQTMMGAVVFRRRNGSIKSVFAVPHVHYGPFGTLGGSRLPQVLSERIRQKYKADALVFHGLVNHDMNPLHADQCEKISEEVEKLVQSASGFSSKGFLCGKQIAENQVCALGFGNSAFISITRAPYSTEDFDLGAGMALRNLALGKFQNAVVVDRHNSLTNGEMFDVGTEVYNNYADAIASLAKKNEGPLKVGVWSNPLGEFTPKDGIGGAGLKVAVMGFGAKRACIVLVDGNNATPPFRQKVLDSLKKHEFDFVDLFTTDTHAVNTIGGIHNPVGARLDEGSLLTYIGIAVENALADMEPVSAAVATKRIAVPVMGIQRQTELVSTINAIVSVAKVIAPIVFLLSLLLVFLAFKWMV